MGTATRASRFRKATENGAPRRSPASGCGLLRLARHGLDRHSRADLLQIADDDLIALGDAADDRDEIAVGLTQRDETLVDFIALADDIDIFAELDSIPARSAAPSAHRAAP